MNEFCQKVFTKSSNDLDGCNRTGWKSGRPISKRGKSGLDKFSQRGDFDRQMLQSAPCWTPEEARANALKSVEVRRAKRLAGENAMRKLAELESTGKAEPQNDRAKRLDAQMLELEIEMIGAEPDAKMKLTAAHARLFSAWCVLTGTKSPGTLGKSRRERPPAPQPIPAPLDTSSPTPPANEDWKQFTG